MNGLGYAWKSLERCFSANVTEKFSWMTFCADRMVNGVFILQWCYISFSAFDKQCCWGDRKGQCLKWSKKEAGSFPQAEVECPLPRILFIYF